MIELMEATLTTPVNCDDPVCLIRKTCTLKNILFDAQEHFLAHVGRYTLADLTESALPLSKLLSKGNRIKPAQS